MGKKHQSEVLYCTQNLHLDLLMNPLLNLSISMRQKMINLYFFKWKGGYSMNTSGPVIMLQSSTVTFYTVLYPMSYVLHLFILFNPRIVYTFKYFETSHLRESEETPIESTRR